MIAWDDLKGTGSSLTSTEYNAMVTDQKSRALDSDLTTHTGSSTIHFLEGSIDHTAITNIGTKNHTQIDAHISSTGSDHTWLDQDVTTTGSATFDNLTITGSQIINNNLTVSATGSFNEVQAVTGSFTNLFGDGSGLTNVSGGGGASFTYKEKINGEAYTGNIGYFVVPDELDTKVIKEVRIAVLGLNTGAALKVDIRKNGTATTDSVFTSDVEIEIGTGETTTNGIYQTGCDISAATVGTPGTTLDSARDDLVADDVLYVYITQVGTILAGTDLIVEVIIG